MSIKISELPEAALLKQYQLRGAYTDCYVMELPRAVSFAEYVEAFYTTKVFKVERAILALLAGKRSTDQQAKQLAWGQTSQFAAWTVEERTDNQILLCDFMKHTRSWLMCCAAESSTPATRLYFGSAVIPKRESADGKRSFGFAFHALYGFHHAYTRTLMQAARARLTC